MKKYHLTFLCDGKYVTQFVQASSLETFMANEIELGREIHLLYSRELSIDEWMSVNRHLSLIQKLKIVKY
jgi:hypothetical protein